jgi:O-antigen ligase
LLLVVVGEVFYAQIVAKVSLIEGGGGRMAIVLDLLHYISQYPYTGIGLSQYSMVGATGTFPHNNILGLAAELGLFVASAYVVFIIAIVWYGVRELRRSNCRMSQCSLAILSLTVFAYLQIKGLVQDTWQLKENYLWAGALVGSLEHVKRMREKAAYS